MFCLDRVLESGHMDPREGGGVAAETPRGPKPFLPSCPGKAAKKLRQPAPDPYGEPAWHHKPLGGHLIRDASLPGATTAPSKHQGGGVNAGDP